MLVKNKIVVKTETLETSYADAFLNGSSLHINVIHINGSIDEIVFVIHTRHPVEDLKLNDYTR